MLDAEMSESNLEIGVGIRRRNVSIDLDGALNLAVRLPLLRQCPVEGYPVDPAFHVAVSAHTMPAGVRPRHALVDCLSCKFSIPQSH